MKKILLLFFLETFIYISVEFIFNRFVATNDIFLERINTNYTGNQLTELLRFKDKWQNISYLLIPLFLFIKTISIAIILDLGLYFYNQKLKFIKLWQFSLTCEICFIALELVKILFLSFSENHNWDYIMNFIPLSALSITGYDISSYFIYILKQLNLFHLIYVLFITFLISKKLRLAYEKALNMILISYIPLFFLWTILNVFLLLNID